MDRFIRQFWQTTSSDRSACIEIYEQLMGEDPWAEFRHVTCQIFSHADVSRFHVFCFFFWFFFSRIIYFYMIFFSCMLHFFAQLIYVYMQLFPQMIHLPSHVILFDSFMIFFSYLRFFPPRYIRLMFQMHFFSHVILFNSFISTCDFRCSV